MCVFLCWCVKQNVNPPNTYVNGQLLCVHFYMCVWVSTDMLPTSLMSANLFLDQLISLISSSDLWHFVSLSGQSINHYGHKAVLFCPCSMTRPGCQPPQNDFTHRRRWQRAWKLQNIQWLWRHTNRHRNALAHARAHTQIVSTDRLWNESTSRKYIDLFLSWWRCQVSFLIADS